MIGVIATSVGVVAGIQQFTASARLRRLSTWVTETLPSETNEGRSATLMDMRALATARLVGRRYVPDHMFLPGVFWGLLGLGLSVAAIDSASNWTYPLFVTTASAALMALHLPGALILYRERNRITRDYLKGVHPIQAPQLPLAADADPIEALTGTNRLTRAHRGKGRPTRGDRLVSLFVALALHVGVGGLAWSLMGPSSPGFVVAVGVVGTLMVLSFAPAIWDSAITLEDVHQVREADESAVSSDPDDLAR